MGSGYEQIFLFSWISYCLSVSSGARMGLSTNRSRCASFIYQNLFHGNSFLLVLRQTCGQTKRAIANERE